MSTYQQKKSAGIGAQIVEFVFLLLLIFLIRTFVFGLYQVPSGSMETTMLEGERFFANKFSYWFRNPRRGETIAFNAPTYVYSDNQFEKLFEQYAWGPENWTKRIIGVPGDHVRGVIENGKPVVYLNNEKRDEPYLNRYPLLKVRIMSSQVASGNVGYIKLKSYDPQRPFEDQPFYIIQPERVIRDKQGNMQMVQPGSLIAPHQDVTPSDANYWNGSDQFNIKLGPDEYWVMGDNRLGSSDSRVFGPIKAGTIHGRIVFRIWSVDSTESWWIVDLIKHPVDFWSRVRWNRFFQWVN